MFKKPSQVFWILEHVHKNKIAVQYLEDKQVVSKTYGQFVAEIRERITELEAEIGSLDGLHIAIVKPYSYSFVVDFFAIMLAGGVTIPFNDKEKEDYISYGLELTETDYVIKEEGILKGPGLGKSKEGYRDFKSGTKLSLMLFTSGTTGKPKAVPLTFEAFSNNIPSANLATIKALGRLKTVGADLIKDGSVYLMIPLYHIGGASVMLPWLLFGETVNFCFDMKYMYKDIEAMPSTITVTIPVVLKAWVKDIERGKNRLGTLKILGVGGAPVDSHSIEVCRENKIYILQAYGLTELGCISNSNLLSDFDKMNSVGASFSSYKAKIKDDEICFYVGDSYLGYYRNPEATKEIYEDGFVKTGDIGYIGSQDELYITGRKKNIIILSSGENINPEELEDRLEGCQFIEDCQVVAEDDHLTARIFAKEKNQDKVQDFIQEMNRSLPIYKKITRVHFVEKPMERTALGKIKRS